MAKRKTRTSRKKKRTARRKTTASKGTQKYVVEATVRMKSKRLSKAQADRVSAKTKREVRGATVKVKKV